MAHLWAKWLRHPCHLGDPQRFRAGGGDQKWPTSGQSGYVTPAVSGIPTASERGAKSEVSHLWAKFFFLLSFLVSKKFFFLLSSLLSKKKFFYSVSQLSRDPTY